MRGWLLLGLLALGCSDPFRGCRWEPVDTLENTIVDRCMLVYSVRHVSLDAQCSEAPTQCVVVPIGGTVTWYRDAWDGGTAEVQPMYVECHETCADYGY